MLTKISSDVCFFLGAQGGLAVSCCVVLSDTKSLLVPASGFVPTVIRNKTSGHIVSFVHWNSTRAFAFHSRRFFYMRISAVSFPFYMRMSAVSFSFYMRIGAVSFPLGPFYMRISAVSFFFTCAPGGLLSQISGRVCKAVLFIVNYHCIYIYICLYIGIHVYMYIHICRYIHI